MAAFSPATHKAVVGSTTNAKDDVKVDTRDLLARLLLDMGLLHLIAQNTPPANRDALWWHKDVRQVKRYDAVQGNWFQATPNQIAMHLERRAVLGSVTEVNLESGDLFTFWDVSLGETKVIARDSLMNALGALRTIATTEGIKGGGTLGANRTFSLDIPGLPNISALAGDDKLVIYDASGNAHFAGTLSQLATFLAPESDTSDYPIGSHILARFTGADTILPRATMAGTRLFPVSIANSNGTPSAEGSAVGIGTWRNMGNTATEARYSLWRRIS